MSVQIDFVAGTLLSAFFSLSDIMSSRRLFFISAMLGAGSNAAFVVLANGLAVAISMRFLTGLFLASIYLPGMKLATTWSRHYLGVAIGLLLGALTVGSASPHLVRSLTDVPWRQVVFLSPILASVGRVIVLLVWGFTVVADSAQFSATVTELSPPR